MRHGGFTNSLFLSFLGSFLLLFNGFFTTYTIHLFLVTYFTFILSVVFPLLNENCRTKDVYIFPSKLYRQRRNDSETYYTFRKLESKVSIILRFTINETFYFGQSLCQVIVWLLRMQLVFTF